MMGFRISDAVCNQTLRCRSNFVYPSDARRFFIRYIYAFIVRMVALM